MGKIQGVLTALVTPFKNGQVDVVSLKKLVRHQIDGGIHGLVVIGTTSESPTLSDQEKKQIFDIVKSEVAGQVPLIVGVSSNCTTDAIAKAQRTADWDGVDALLCVVPYYNKPPQRGLLHYFQQITQSMSIPILLYNVPSRTVTSLKLESIITLAENHKIVGIKEASGDMIFDKALLEHFSKNRMFAVLSGDDGTFGPFMELGGCGIISVISNLLPLQTATVYNSYVDKDITKANLQFQELKKYIDLLSFDTNPIPIKTALYVSGFISNLEFRSPLMVPETQQIQQLKKEITI